MTICKKILTIGFLAFLITGCSSKNKTENALKSIEPTKKVIKSDSLYEKERKNFLQETMYMPQIPIKTPDKILRVLVMPYVDDDKNLQMENYHFVKVDDGRWVLGEYLNGQNREKSNNRYLTPLKAK